MTLIGMIFMLMVVKRDEDVDGYGNGDKRVQPTKQPPQPTHLQPNPPYYFILTAYPALNLQSHRSHNVQSHHYHNP